MTDIPRSDGKHVAGSKSARMLGFSLAATIVLLCGLSLRAAAGPDFPWKCRDADAVLHAARKYSARTQWYSYDLSKLRQARREYAGCLHDAADDEDRVRAIEGMIESDFNLGYVIERVAEITNIRSESESKRKAFFEATKAAALDSLNNTKEMYAKLQELADLAGVDISDFTGWMGNRLNEAIAMANGLQFSRIPSYAALHGTHAPPSAGQHRATTTAVPEFVDPSPQVVTPSPG